MRHKNIYFEHECINQICDNYESHSFFCSFVAYKLMMAFQKKLVFQSFALKKLLSKAPQLTRKITLNCSFDSIGRVDDREFKLDFSSSNS